MPGDLRQRVSLNADEEALLDECLSSEDYTNEEWYKQCTVHYTLPQWRASLFLKLILLCDLIATCTLWLTGKRSKHILCV